MRAIIAIAICFVSVAGAIENGFPDDPAGVEVIDRAFIKEISALDGEVLYMRLFNDEDQGTVELFRGTPEQYRYSWEMIYSWQPRLYGDDPYKFLPVCVISIQTDGNPIRITWVQALFTEYIEGLGTLYLEYNLESGEISESYVD